MGGVEGLFEGGWMGTILRIDLSKKKIFKEHLKKEFAIKYVGGIGFTTKILFDEVKPGTDPLGPNNKLIIAVGPCNGTIVPGSSRCTVAAKSPLSGFIGDSNAGGSFGAELKYAGYDLVIIEGRAEKLSYLWINDDDIQLKDAEHLRGKTTSETRRAIERDCGDPEVGVLSIGPAGEYLVKFACIISGVARAHGRCGLGAVMGSKNLKAIVVRGSKGIKVAKPDFLENLVQEMYSLYREEYKEWYYGITTLGTPRIFLDYIKFGTLATRNYQSGVFEYAEDLSPIRFKNSYVITRSACFSCPIGCNLHFVIDKEPYMGTYGQAVENVQFVHFGPRLGNKSLNALLKMHVVANELGMDVADLSGVLAFACECFEKGILTEHDTGGLKLEWGDYETFLKLIEMIAYRKGFGDILAEGLKGASMKIGKGSEKYAMHVKGLSLDSLDPRGLKGWGLGYAISSRGADHCRHLFVSERIETDRLAVEGKAEAIVWHENIRAFQNSLEICEFCGYYGKMLSPDLLAKLYNAVTGIDLGKEELMVIGERIVNLARAYNVREGLTRKDDTLPDRFTKTPMPDGPSKGQIVEIEYMIDRYYELRGWDKKTGFPTKKKLLALGLEEVARDLHARHLLVTEEG